MTDNKKDGVTLAIVQDAKMNDEMINKIKEHFNEAGVAVTIIPEGKVYQSHMMERKYLGDNIVIVPGFGNREAKSLVEMISEMEKPVEAHYDDREPQHLIQKNSADLPFYHNRRRW